MKYLIVKDYNGLWEAEYRTAGMKNSDNETVVGIKSRRYVDGVWVENFTDLDDDMVSLGLPNKVGYRFDEKAMVVLAAAKNLTITKIHEKETPEVLNTADPSESVLLLDFVLAEQTGAAVINHDLETVAIEVANGTVVTALEPVVTVSPYATVNPLSGAATNFTNPVNYTVTAQDGVTTKVYAVTVTKAAA